MCSSKQPTCFRPAGPAEHSCRARCPPCPEESRHQSGVPATLTCCGRTAYLGDLLMVGGGRDLKTAESGHGTAVREGSMRLEISTPALKVQSVSAGGVEAKVQDLAGANIFGGFRRNLAAVAAGPGRARLACPCWTTRPWPPSSPATCPLRPARSRLRTEPPLFNGWGVSGLEGRGHRRHKPGSDRQCARAPGPSGFSAA